MNFRTTYLEQIANELDGMHDRLHYLRPDEVPAFLERVKLLTDAANELMAQRNRTDDIDTVDRTPSDSSPPSSQDA